MYFWICAKCGRKVWCCDTCNCGNTRDKNAELIKERERICNRCGKSETFECTYPKIEFEDIDTRTSKERGGEK